jgi:opacity protein-like surface antigen
MREFIIAAAALALTAGPSFAQGERGYVNLGGGIAASSDATSGELVGEVGVRVARNLFVFGDLGQFHNLQPSLVQPAVDATAAMLATTGVAVTGTARVPAWYSIGGIRFSMPTASGVAPYVLGGAGFARLTPAAQFIDSSGTLGGSTPTVGDDVTGQLVTLGDFTQPPPTSAFMFTAGGGVQLPVAPHVSVDVGYRLSRVNGDTPISAQSFVAGIGYKF